MAFVIEESWLPATLSVPVMDDVAFDEFCSEHPDLFFEVTAEGDLLVMPPNYTLTGVRNGEIFGQLHAWTQRDGRGIASDPSTGFVLPSSARRSPDAAWTAKARVRALAPEMLHRYWHLCPDFVIELRSPSDRLPVLRAKMEEWLANGAALGWLIDPDRRVVEVFRQGEAVQVVEDCASVAGEGPVAGFVLELAAVWNPLGE